MHAKLLECCCLQSVVNLDFWFPVRRSILFSSVGWPLLCTVLSSAKALCFESTAAAIEGFVLNDGSGAFMFGILRCFFSCIVFSSVSFTSLVAWQYLCKWQTVDFEGSFYFVCEKSVESVSQSASQNHPSLVHSNTVNNNNNSNILNPSSSVHNLMWGMIVSVHVSLELHKIEKYGLIGSLPTSTRTSLWIVLIRSVKATNCNDWIIF